MSSLPDIDGGVPPQEQEQHHTDDSSLGDTTTGHDGRRGGLRPTRGTKRAPSAPAACVACRKRRTVYNGSGSSVRGAADVGCDCIHSSAVGEDGAGTPHPQNEDIDMHDVSSSATRSVESTPTTALPPPSTPSAGQTGTIGPQCEEKLSHLLQSKLQDIRSGLEIQQRCISKIFCAFTAEQMEDSLSKFSDHQIKPSRSAICEMCAIAAVASLYGRERLSAELGDCFYDGAKLFLPDCIEASPLSAMKACALLGLFNLLNKATVALSFIELGLRLAADRSSALAQQSGQMYSQQAMSLENPIPQDIDPCIDSDEFAQREITNIAILKARSIQMLWKAQSGPDLIGAVKSTKDALNSWYTNLPTVTRMSHLMEMPKSMSRTAVLYIHLLHLGTYMLIHRRMMMVFGESKDALKQLSHDHVSEVKQAFVDGVVAARQSLRILDLLLNEQECVKHCWIVILQSYVASCILLHDATQARLHGCSPSAYEQAMDLAGKGLAVLRHCAELDIVANVFEERLACYALALYAIYPPTGQLSRIFSPNDDTTGSAPCGAIEHYLSDTSSKKSALLDISRRLRNLVCVPYDGEQSPSFKATVANPPRQAPDISLAKLDQNDVTPEDVARMLRDASTFNVPLPHPERFVGSSEPCGWVTERSSVTFRANALSCSLF